MVPIAASAYTVRWRGVPHRGVRTSTVAQVGWRAPSHPPRPLATRLLHLGVRGLRDLVSQVAQCSGYRIFGNPAFRDTHGHGMQIGRSVFQ
jgi:hypothetical protein